MTLKRFLSDWEKVNNMKTLIVKSLLSSLYQREAVYPSLAKRGVGRFFDNDALLVPYLILNKVSLRGAK
jgi:hypothetical protein